MSIEKKCKKICLFHNTCNYHYFFLINANIVIICMNKHKTANLARSLGILILQLAWPLLRYHSPYLRTYIKKVVIFKIVDCLFNLSYLWNGLSKFDWQKSENIISNLGSFFGLISPHGVMHGCRCTADNTAELNPSEWFSIYVFIFY